MAIICAKTTPYGTCPEQINPKIDDLRLVKPGVEREPETVLSDFCEFWLLLREVGPSHVAMSVKKS